MTVKFLPYLRSSSRFFFPFYTRATNNDLSSSCSIHPCLPSLIWLLRPNITWLGIGSSNNSFLSPHQHFCSLTSLVFIHGQLRFKPPLGQSASFSSRPGWSLFVLFYNNPSFSLKQEKHIDLGGITCWNRIRLAQGIRYLQFFRQWNGLLGKKKLSPSSCAQANC